jgi:hypothetical protein
MTNHKLMNGARERSEGLGMTRLTLLATVCCAALTVAAVSSQQRSSVPGERTIRQNKGAAIAAQFRPGDKTLRVVATRPMPLVVEPPPGTPMEDWLTKMTEGSWLVRIASANGRLSDDGDFVETDVTATILETFKAGVTELPSEVGEKLTFVLSGGETTVDGVRVQAIVPWTKQPQVGQTYVLFADWDREAQRLIVGPVGLYEQTPAGFTTLLLKVSPARQKLNGSTEQTLRAIRMAGLHRQ